MQFGPRDPCAAHCLKMMRVNVVTQRAKCPCPNRSSKCVSNLTVCVRLSGIFITLFVCIVRCSHYQRDEGLIRSPELIVGVLV